MFPKSRKELNDYIRKGNQQEINLIAIIRALKAIEGLTSEDICGTPQEKMGKIYSLAHHALNHCAGCGRNETDIFSEHAAMVYFGQTEKPMYRKVVLPDGSRVKCLA